VDDWRTFNRGKITIYKTEKSTIRTVQLTYNKTMNEEFLVRKPLRKWQLGRSKRRSEKWAVIARVLFYPTMGFGTGSGKTSVPTTHYWKVSANIRHISVTNNKQDRQCTYNNVVRSRNHCCNGNPIIRSVRFVELHVAVNNIKIISVAQICLYGEIMWPATIKHYWIHCCVFDWTTF
jgi:hypothetical protein